LQMTDVSIRRPEPLPREFNPELIVAVDDPRT
jgi:hypothetical protein